MYSVTYTPPALLMADWVEVRQGGRPRASPCSPYPIPLVQFGQLKIYCSPPHQAQEETHKHCSSNGSLVLNWGIIILDSSDTMYAVNHIWKTTYYVKQFWVARRRHIPIIPFCSMDGPSTKCVRQYWTLYRRYPISKTDFSAKYQKNFNIRYQIC